MFYGGFHVLLKIMCKYIYFYTVSMFNVIIFAFSPIFFYVYPKRINSSTKISENNCFFLCEYENVGTLYGQTE